MKTRTIEVILATGLLLASAPALAKGKVERYNCSLNHFVRDGGAEMRTGTVSVRNFDLEHPVTLERLTIRKIDGTIVHDSGPAAGTPHPLNTDFGGALDVTTVAPGGNIYLSTRHIWGINPLPPELGNNPGGVQMNATVVISKAHGKARVAVGRRDQARARIPIGPGVAIEGAESSSNVNGCTRLD